MTKTTRAKLESLNYGRGAERMIRGAKFAVVLGPTAHPQSVLSTHRTYAAAAAVLQRANRNGIGVINIHEIV